MHLLCRERVVQHDGHAQARGEGAPQRHTWSGPACRLSPRARTQVRVRDQPLSGQVPGELKWLMKVGPQVGEQPPEISGSVVTPPEGNVASRS